jgi:Arc/MetJ family transcription regulator
MARTIIDVDDEALRQAQAQLRTTTKKDTVNAALQLAVAVGVDERTRLLTQLEDVMGRLDTDLIEREEADDHRGHAA